MPPPVSPSPPTPPPIQEVHIPNHSINAPVHDDFGVTNHVYDDISAQEAAQEFEDAVTAATNRSEAKKRSAEQVLSDASSELDTVSTKTKQPANKKRKTGGAGAVDVVTALRASAAGKKKGKQATREGSMDSTSGAKPPKRRNVRRKLETGVLQNRDLLSVAPSLSAGGDLTPGTSRPSSPAMAPTADRLNATVFGLDEPVPQLKKAKKVDDATMLKRVRALEETQKKVWTTIARRDIPKVCPIRVRITQVHGSNRIIGVQVSSVRLPIKTGSTQTYIHALFCSRKTAVHPDGQGREGDPDEGEETDEGNDGVLEEERKGGEGREEEGAERGSRSGQSRGGEEGGSQAGKEAGVLDQSDRAIQPLRREQTQE